MMKLLTRAESVYPFDRYVIMLKELQIEYQVEQIEERNTKERLVIYQKWESHLLKGLVTIQYIFLPNLTF